MSESGSPAPDRPVVPGPLPQDVLDRVADAVVTFDGEWRFASLNRSARSFVTRLGHDPARLLGTVIWESFPELRGTPLEAAARAVVARGEEARLEFHYPPTGGWYHTRLVPLPPGLAAFALDVTAAHRAEHERARAEQAELRSRRILESIGDAFCVLDHEWRVAFANARVGELSGQAPDALLGRAAWQLLAGAAGARLDERLRRAADERRPVVFELALEGRPERWLEVHANPTPDGTAVHLYDVTERKRAEGRTRFLTTVSAELAASLDPAETLDRVARLVVPTLADLCGIYLVDEYGEPRGVTGWTADPALRELARTITREHRPLLIGDASPVLRAIRTGEAQYVPELPAALVAAVPAGGATGDRLQRFEPRAGLVVPLVARDATIGAIALFLGASGRDFDAADREVAIEVGRRAAIAIDNARLYRDAVEANAAKATFLAVMSHELRTPLTAIIGYTELMADEVVGPVNAVQREQLGRVRASGAHLLTLIEEILAFARIEAGQESVRREVVDVGEVVHEARAVVEPLLRRKALECRVVVAEPPPTLHTDAGKLRQILLNLLANAIKFTDHGEVRVLVVAEPSADAPRLVIAVEDTGVGIAPANLDRIFDPFWQVEQTRTRKAGGTGLGLSVARQLAQLLEGELTVTSTVGVGTAFRLALPLG